MFVRVGLLSMLVLAHAEVVRGATTVQTLNPWPGIYGESAADMTRDGSLVVGSVKTYGEGRYETYRWNTSTNFEMLGWVLGAGSLPRAISSDGRVIVGTVNADIGYNSASPFYWKDGEGATFPGLLPGGHYAWATGVSADGSTMVGYGDNPASVAWKWTASGGYQILPMPAGFTSAWTAPHGISATGDTIAGYVQGGNASTFPARWTASGVQVCPVQGFAQAIQPDGQAILFASNGAERWRVDGTIETLGTYPNSLATWPNATSDDGSIVGGSGIIAPYTGRAWIWTSTLGLVDLHDYLASRGIDVSQWTFDSVEAISADGTKICGFGTHRYGSGYSRDETFIVTVPGPVSAPILAIGALVANLRKRPTLSTRSRAPCSAATC